MRPAACNCGGQLVPVRRRCIQRHCSFWKMPINQPLMNRICLNGCQRRSFRMHPRDFVGACIVRPKFARIARIERGAST